MAFDLSLYGGTIKGTEMPMPNAEKAEDSGKIYDGIRQPYDSVSVGNWDIEFNYPFGVVLINAITREEYHFHAHSNGWVTSVHRNEKTETKLCYSTRSLLTNSFYPDNNQLVDKASTARLARILFLQNKDETFKNLTPEEKQELLELTGLLKK